MYTTKITIVTLLFLLLSSCQKRENIKNNYLIQNEKEKVEDFDVFIKKFYSDSLFQINRIVFPLESETDSVMNKERIEEKDPKAVIDSSNFIPHNKNNWLMLSIDQTFNKDSVKIVDRIKYIRRFYKTTKDVEEHILYANDKYVFIIIKFKLLNGVWYLVDYQNELDN